MGRNLDDDLSMRAPPPAPAPMPHHGGHPGHQLSGPGMPAKRHRTSDNLDTICVLGLTEKGLTHCDIHQWFQHRPDFVALQVNERIDALFVKFANGTAAEQAMHDAN